MRNLTIKRAKSFVACLVKMKIYIEDPTAAELYISGTPCRKLGNLKNGKEVTFQIGDAAARIYVIADTASKDYCNEYYQLPEGQEDIVLTGKNKFNPAAGNPFRFDNNTSQGVQAQRKKNSKIGTIVLIVAAVLGGIIGFFFGYGGLSTKAPEPKTFVTGGMSITLTDAFQKMAVDGYDAAYDSRNVAVFALKEPLSLVEGFADYGLTDYAELLLEVNNQTDKEIKTQQGRTYFDYSYQNPETEALYHYYTYVYKTEDAFWAVQFALLESDVPAFADQITQWAASVTF